GYPRLSLEPPNLRTLQAAGVKRLPCRRYPTYLPPARFVIVEDLLQLRFFRGVGAERQVELVVVRAFLDVALAGEGDAHAAVDAAQHRVRRLERERFLIQGDGDGAVLRDPT